MNLLRNSAMIVAALGLGACSDSTREPVVGPGRPGVALGLAASTLTPRVGDTVTVAVTLGQESSPVLAGLQATIHFDPDRLRYLGQQWEVGRPTIVNAAGADQGSIRFATVAPGGLGSRPSLFAFLVRAPLELSPWRLVVEDALIEPVVPARFRVDPAVGQEPGLPRLLAPERLTIEDWANHLDGPGRGGQDGPKRSPGDGLIYGDSNLNGVVTFSDGLRAANVSVGNDPLLTNLTTDMVVAANVEPSNAPGLGEADDAVPPGVNPDGTRAITIADALAIANVAVHNPHPVAGFPIPGRTTAANRVVLSGQVLADRHLTRDTIYELEGLVIVRRPATLTIDPGTRIEGQTATLGTLSVRIGGRVVALGTVLEPIVFTCTAEPKTPGCWGGIGFDGASPLNNGDIGQGNELQCPVKVEPTGGIYGGCQPDDDSGQLRYVRIEFAGGGGPGLGLYGVGAGTFLQSIQIRQSAGEGIFVSGGYANLREVLVTQAGGDGLRWDDGWQGKAQSVIIYRAMGAGAGIRGSNAPVGVAIPGLTSHPTVYNLTIVEANPANPPGLPALLFERGTGAVVRNAIVLGWTSAGLDVQDAETCANAPTGLEVGFSIFFANQPNFSDDVDCFDEVGYGADPARGFVIVDPQLIGPAITRSPDLRPAAQAVPGAVPPADGFLDPTLTYIGAVPVGGAGRIPWYAGWSVGF